jgi:hypothetical protein
MVLNCSFADNGLRLARQSSSDEVPGRTVKSFDLSGSVYIGGMVASARPTFAYCRAVAFFGTASGPST